MYNATEQFADINKAGYDNAVKLASLSLEKAERFTKLNLQAAKVALEQGVYCFNLESEAELAYTERIAAGKGVRAPIALRVNPDVESGSHHYITTGRSENKFGIALDRVRSVYETAARLPHVLCSHFQKLQR